MAEKRLLRVLWPLPKQFYEVINIEHKYLPYKFIGRLKIFQTAFANP